MSYETLEGGQEDNILTAIVWNEQIAPTLAVTVPWELFQTKHYQKIAKVSIDYINRFGHPPEGHVRDLLESDIRKGDDAKFLIQAIDATQRWHTGIHTDYIMATLDDWIRVRRRYRALNIAFDKLTAGDEQGCEEALWEDRAFAPKINAGTWMHDTDMSFLGGTRDEAEFGSGIQYLDQRGIRPSRGTLTMFVAPKKFGKCVVGGELITLPNGQRKPIRDVVRDQDTEVICVNPASGLLQRARVSDHAFSGYQECYAIVTSTGRTVATTAEHMYLTPEGWRPLTDLRVNVDYIAVPIIASNMGQIQVPPEVPRLLGYLLADGGLTKPNTPTFTKAEEAIRCDFERCVDYMGDKVTWAQTSYIGYIVGGSGNVPAWLRKLGLLGKLSKHKTIPQEVFTWDDEAVADLLGALFSCDGWISPTHIGMSLASFDMAEQIKHLLLRVGVVASISYQTARYKGKEFPDYGRLAITSKADIQQFVQKVPLIGKAQTIGQQVHETIGTRATYNKHRRKAWTEEVAYEKVMAIFSVGVCDTYDLTVPQYENFVANDVVLHNSWYCCTIGKAAIMSGRSCLHISLENSVNLTKRRYMQAIFAMTKQEAQQQFRVPVFVRNKAGQCESIEFGTINALALTRSNQVEILRRLQSLERRPRLLIKEFPTSSLTIPMLNAYLDFLRRSERFEPDMLIIDYPDLMRLDSDNLRIDTGNTFRRLRGIAVERNLAMFCPTQGNRQSDGAKIVTSRHLAEDWSKAGTADTVLTGSRTPAEKKHNLARIFVDAARDEEDSYIVLISQSYATGQFCIDSVYFSQHVESKVDHVVGEDERPNAEAEADEAQHGEA